MKLQGKVCIVTGGSKGIGYGIAEEFLKEGAMVTICSRNKEEGEHAKAKLAKLGKVLYLQIDVSDLQDLQHLVDVTVETFGGLDVYVANAGTNDPDKTHFLNISEAQYDRIMDVNLKAMMFGDQYAARYMADHGGGVIINTASVNSYLGLDSQVVYTTSKGAVTQLTKVQAIALAPYNIKVNAIAPGPIETEMMLRVGSDEQLYNTILSRTPMGRIGKPNECGRLAVFLACSDSDFVFGQSIYIDGGRGFQAFPTPGYKTVTDDDYEILCKYKEEKL